MGMDVKDFISELKGVRLVRACMYGDYKGVKQLIEGGLDIEGNQGLIGLLYASKHNNVDVVKLLIESGVDVNRKSSNKGTLLMLLSATERFDIMRLFIKAGADVNFREEDGYGTTPLMLAASNGILENVKLLLEAGADVNVKNNDGETALMIATRNGYKNVIEYLKANGAV